VNLGQRLLRLCTVLVVALVVGHPAVARAAVQQLATDVGVTLAVPAELRRASGLAGLSELAGATAPLATFTDAQRYILPHAGAGVRDPIAGVKPLVVVVQRGAPHGHASLPAATEAGALEWTRGFAAALNVPQVFDVTPGPYEPERGTVSLTYKVRGPSSARLMLGLPDSHPLWKPVIAVGGDPESSRCVLGWLLGGKPYATEAELRAHTPNAARECGYGEEDIAEYIAQLGALEFAPAVSSITCLAFLTRTGTLVTLTIAPLERVADIDRVVATLRAQSVVDPEARLAVMPARSAWFHGGRLFGVVLGSFLMLVVLGGAVAFGLVRLRVSSSTALGSTFGLLMALSLVSMLRADAVTLPVYLQTASYVLASLIAYRPLRHWLDTRGGAQGPRLLRDSRGLSTVEYVIVLVLLACVAIGAWRLFGASVKSAVTSGTTELAELESADYGPGSASDFADEATAAGPTGDLGPSSRPATGAGNSTTSNASPAAATADGVASGVGQALTPGSVPAAGSAPAPSLANAAPPVAAAAAEPTLLVTGADIATDFTPGVSNVKDASIAITGVNPVTGEQVGTVGRVAAGVFAVPGIGNTAKYAIKGTKLAAKGVAKGAKILSNTKAGAAVVGWVGSKLGRTATREATSVKVLGRQVDTAVAKNWDGHEVLDTPNWTLQKNAEWVDSGIQTRQNFYLASPREGNLIQTTGPFKGQPTVYALELQQLEKAGYKQMGDYMVHPSNVTTFVP
jgi:Flp pilus assembly pilin Flp